MSAPTGVPGATPSLPPSSMPPIEDLRLLARTKIVATVGPSCSDPEILTALVRAGADVFRLNMAHGTIEQQQVNVDNIRRISEELATPIGILVDLAGPKFRLGEVEDDRIFCETDDEFSFVEGKVSAQPNEFTCTYAPLVQELSVGDNVMLADGTVSMVVVGKEPGRALMKVVQRGVDPQPPGRSTCPASSSARRPSASIDHQHAIWAAEAGVDFVSLSFVRAPDEVRALRDILRSNDSERLRDRRRSRNARRSTASKRSSPPADAVMVARGDLGVEIDVAEMPVRAEADHRHLPPLSAAGDHRHADARQHARLAAAQRGPK